MQKNKTKLETTKHPSTRDWINKLGKLSWSARAPITKYHTQGSVNNINIFLIVLEAGSTDQDVSRFGFPGSLSAWLADGGFVTVSSHGPLSVDTSKDSF